MKKRKSKQESWNGHGNSNVLNMAPIGPTIDYKASKSKVWPTKDTAAKSSLKGNKSKQTSGNVISVALSFHLLKDFLVQLKPKLNCKVKLASTCVGNKARLKRREEKRRDLL